MGLWDCGVDPGTSHQCLNYYCNAFSFPRDLRATVESPGELPRKMDKLKRLPADDENEHGQWNISSQQTQAESKGGQLSLNVHRANPCLKVINILILIQFMLPDMYMDLVLLTLGSKKIVWITHPSRKGQTTSRWFCPINSIIKLLNLSSYIKINVIGSFFCLV